MYRITKFFEFLRARFENHKTVWLTAFVFLSLHRNGLCVPLCSFSRDFALWRGSLGVGPPDPVAARHLEKSVAFLRDGGNRLNLC